MANGNKSNRKGGSNASILNFFSKTAPKRSAKSSKLNDKPKIMSSFNDFSMTPLPSSSTPFNPNVPPSSSAATPASISSVESSDLSVAGEVTIESSSLQQQQQHDTSVIASSATPTANIHHNDSPLTPPTPLATHELENKGTETPPSPDSQATFTPETPPTPESEQSKHYVGKKRKRQLPQDVMTAAETPQDLLDRHDDECVNEHRTERHQQKEILATETTPSIDDSKSCAASKPSSYSATSSIKRRTYSNKKRSFNSYTTPKPQQQQQQQQQQQPVQKKKKKSNQQQMFLDFGQSSFGKRTVCKICGMLRVHGVAEDDIEHAKVCKVYKEGVTCLGWKNERKVEEFGGNNLKTNDRILEVREGDALQHRRKVLEVKRIVDGELGFAVSSSGGRNGDDAEIEQDSLDGLTSYLYISNKRVVGLLMVKRIQRAYQVVVPKTNNSNSDESSSLFSISRSLKPSRALLGIHQIWVHSSHRKKGIASKLVTAARDHLIFGMMIPLELIAFSSPTMEGLRFAKSYLDVERPLVYDIN